MNKKGFTLVELLAVIAILAIVIAFAAKSITTIRNNSFQKLLDTKITDLEAAAAVYGQENPNIFTYDVTGVTFKVKSGDKEIDIVTNYYIEVNVKDLIDKDYYETKEEDKDGNYDLINNVTNKSMLCDTLLIYRKNNRVNAVIREINSNKEDYVCNLKVGG